MNPYDPPFFQNVYIRMVMRIQEEIGVKKFQVVVLQYAGLVWKFGEINVDFCYHIFAKLL